MPPIITPNVAPITTVALNSVGIYNAFRIGSAYHQVVSAPSGGNVLTVPLGVSNPAPVNMSTAVQVEAVAIDTMGVTISV